MLGQDRGGIKRESRCFRFLRQSIPSPVEHLGSGPVAQGLMWPLVVEPEVAPSSLLASLALALAFRYTSSYFTVRHSRSTWWDLNLRGGPKTFPCSRARSSPSPVRPLLVPLSSRCIGEMAGP